MIEYKFPLRHLLLYSKGWYKKFNPKSSRKTIWDDLRVILTLDGYQGDVMRRSDIVSVILSKCQGLADVRAFELLEFAYGISEGNAWQCGYFTKHSPYGETDEEYNYFEAILYYCIAHLRFIDVKYHGKLPMPDYEKGLPRKNGISDEDLKKFFPVEL